jgi:glycosyltransferase involved in cell wall biosynthesis
MKEKQVENPVLVIDACQTTLNYNYCLLDALAKKQVNVIYATTKYAREDITLPAGVDAKYCFFYLARIMSRLTSSRKLRRVLRGIEYPINMVALLTYILVRQIKVIHLMNPVFATFDYWMIKLMQRIGCGVVFTAHNPFPHEEKASSAKGFSRIYHQLDHIIALTNFTRNEIVSRAGISEKKISVIPHGDFGYIFSQYSSNDELVDKVREAASGRHIIAFLGLIRPYKGLKFFIQAFPLIKQLRPDTFFLIAGSLLIGDKKELEEMLHQSSESDSLCVDIRFLPISDFKAYLSVTDILVQPYISASQSGNTVMAYSEGIPVISTDVGGLPEMVEDGRTGYVIRPQNPKVIAEAVAKCLDDDILQKMSNRARMLASDKYNWQAIASKTLKIYARLNNKP